MKLSYEDIKTRLNSSETNNLEFKPDFSDGDKVETKIFETIIAMANTAGGDIIIGISESNPRKITGTHHTEISLENKISQWIQEYVDPPNLNIRTYGIESTIEPKLIGIEVSGEKGRYFGRRFSARNSTKPTFYALLRRSNGSTIFENFETFISIVLHQQQERDKEKERERIPDLKFDGFFYALGTEIGERGMMFHPKTYFMRIKNVNQESEGKAEECAGYFTITGTDIVNNPTVWQDNNVRYLNFAHAANLMLLTTQKESKRIIFPHAYEKSGFKISSGDYDDYVTKDLMITLECSRGICSESYTRNIQEIINEALQMKGLG